MTCTLHVVNASHFTVFFIQFPSMIYFLLKVVIIQKKKSFEIIYQSFTFETPKNGVDSFENDHFLFFSQIYLLKKHIFDFRPFSQLLNLFLDRMMTLLIPLVQNHYLTGKINDKVIIRSKTDFNSYENEHYYFFHEIYLLIKHLFDFRSFSQLLKSVLDRMMTLSLILPVKQ